MIQSVKNLSADQKVAIESLLGRPILDGEHVSVRTIPASPDWLDAIQKEAKVSGADKLTMEEIDEEIASARRGRKQNPGK
ncbi:MAG TPA: hypothetical protein VMH04_04460 [Candidatus Solibacter sp.]|nr:hypothetical protein [Candidatus Solibacter sp.]